MSPDPSILWQKTLDKIKHDIGQERFDDWFSQTRIESFANGELTLAVPSQYVSDLYDTTFNNVLFPAIEKFFGQGVQVFYETNIIKDDNQSRVNLSSFQTSASHSGADRLNHPAGRNRQPEFDSHLTDNYNFENYCVGESNRLPYTIARAIAENRNDNTFNPFFLYGNVGVGKTHLMQSIGFRMKELQPGAKVLYVPLREFINQLGIARTTGNIPDMVNFYKTIDLLLVDDIQELTGSMTGTINALFQIFNHLHQSNRKLVFTCDRPPKDLTDITDRMIDRFKWGSIECLNNPDLELRKTILRQKAAQTGVKLTEEVVEVIAQHVSGSIRELQSVIASLLSRSIAHSRPISREMVFEVVRNLVNTPKKTINFDMIVDRTAECYNISSDVIFSRSRMREISDARQMIMYLASKLLNLSSTSIASKLRREHSTVLHGIKTVSERITREHDTFEAANWIENQLNKRG